MKPETKAAINAIYAEANAKHGDVFRGAVDLLAAVASIYAHAGDHCDELAEHVRILGYSAIDRLLTVGGIAHLRGEVCDFANRIVDAKHAGEVADDAPPAPSAPFNPNLH